MKKNLWILMGLLIFVSTIFYSSKVQAQEWKLGVIFPLSGVLAQMGNEGLRAVQFATEVQNEKGGILGKKIRLVVGDAPDAKAGAAEAERLITVENIKLIIGTLSSSIAVTASEVAEKYKIPYFEVIAISDVITERGNKYLWRTCTTSSAYAEMAIDFTKQVTAPQLGIPPEKLRIAIVHEDTLFGTSTAQYLEKHLPAAGFKSIIAKEAYSSRSVDLSSLILKMKGMKPDVLMAVSYVPDAILMRRQAKDLDFNVKAWQGFGGGWGDIHAGEALGKDFDYILSADFPTIYINKEVAPGLDDLVKGYQRRYGELPRSLMIQGGYSGMVGIFDIIKRAGSLDPEAIAKAAWETDIPLWSTPSGWGVKFNGPGRPHPGQNTRAFPYVHQWKDKQQRIVWPQKAKYTDPILPMPTWKERSK